MLKPAVLIRLPQFELRSNLAMTRFYFQVALFVIASRAESTAWQSLKIIFNKRSEVKNNFQVAYENTTTTQNTFQAA